MLGATTGLTKQWDRLGRIAPRPAHPVGIAHPRTVVGPIAAAAAFALLVIVLKAPIDRMVAAATLGALGGLALLCVAVAAASVEWNSSRARLGWLLAVTALAVFVGSTIAGLSAVLSDGALGWRPDFMRWAEVAALLALAAVAALAVPSAGSPNTTPASLLTAAAGFVPVAVLSVLALQAVGVDVDSRQVVPLAVAGAVGLFCAFLHFASDPRGAGSARALATAGAVLAMAFFLIELGLANRAYNVAVAGKVLILLAGFSAAVRLMGRDTDSRPPSGQSWALPAWFPIVGAGALSVAAAGALATGNRAGAPLAVSATLTYALLFAREGAAYRAANRAASELAEVARSLEELANIDLLTGLPNRFALEERLREEMERSIRHKQPLTICFLDIDHFKRVNDQFGHAAGDRLLGVIADCIDRSIRTIDFAARYGGEEFIVIAPATWTIDAAILGERLRAHVESTASAIFSVSTDALTISIGVAGYPEHGTTLEEVMERADAALYEAKRKGRNRVEIWSAEPQPSL